MDTLTEVKKSERLLDEFPFNGVECLTEIYLEEYPRDVLGFCLLSDVVKQSNILTNVSSFYKSSLIWFDENCQYFFYSLSYGF